MTTTLADYQFEILADESATEGVVFGIGSGSVDMEDGGFIPGDDDWTVDDQNDQFNGGVRFGREVLNGPAHGFNLFTNCTDAASARAAIAEFKTAWRALGIRKSPSAVVPCRYQIDGQVRRFYGRPRRFSAPPSNLILGGFVPITTDFQAADAYFYDDNVDTLLLTMRDSDGSSSGGIIFPCIFPVTALPVGSGQGVVVVGGDAPAYPIIRFDGPCSDPRIETPDWTLALWADLSDGDYIEIDTRPWKRTILRNGSSNASGALAADRRQYLSDMVLKPGPTQISFWGTTVSGTPTCTITYRSTFNSY